MSTEIIALESQLENPYAEQDTLIAEAVDYYHHLIRHFWHPDEAARYVDVAFGFVPPPPPERIRARSPRCPYCASPHITLIGRGRITSGPSIGLCRACAEHFVIEPLEPAR